MRTTLIAAFSLLTSCGSNPQPVTALKREVASVVASVRPPQALTQEEILACDRRSVLYEPRKPEAPNPPEQEPPRAFSMKPGDSAYIVGLDSFNRRLYVNRYARISAAPDQTHSTMVRRVTDGFLADCDSPELWVFPQEGDVEGAVYVPVVGHIDVKPRRAVVVTQ